MRFKLSEGRILSHEKKKKKRATLVSVCKKKYRSRLIKKDLFHFLAKFSSPPHCKYFFGLRITALDHFEKNTLRLQLGLSD